MQVLEDRTKNLEVCVCGQRDEYLPLKMNNSYLNTNEFKTQSKTHLINPGFLF